MLYRSPDLNGMLYRSPDLNGTLRRSCRLNSETGAWNRYEHADRAYPDID